MSKRNCYRIIKHVHMTEKSRMLLELQSASSNPSVARFEKSKYVFVVDKSANKAEITSALEEIYPGIKVSKVNTLLQKPKKRRVRGRLGQRAAVKRAIVTLEKGDQIENIYGGDQ